MKNNKSLFFIMTFMVLIIGIGTISATSINNNTNDGSVLNDGASINAQDTTSISNGIETIKSDKKTVKNKITDNLNSNRLEKEKTKSNNNIINNQTKTIKTEDTISVNSENFEEYFTSNGFTDKVTSGSTINIESNISKSMNLSIDKEISLNGNGYTLSLNTELDATNAINLTQNSQNTKIYNLKLNSTPIVIDCSNILLENNSLNDITVNENLENITLTNNTIDGDIKNSSIITEDNNKYATKLSLTANKETIPLGDDLIVTIKLTAGTKAISNASVILTIGSNRFYVTTDENGTYEYRNATSDSAYNRKITATYSGSQGYLASSNSTNYSADRITTSITITEAMFSVTIGDNVTINGTLLDGYNNPIPNTPLTMKVNAQTINLKTDSNGNYNYTIQTNKLGEYDVDVSFDGTTQYYPSSADTFFDVEMAGTNIYLDQLEDYIPKEKFNITGKVEEWYTYKPVTDGTVTITISGFTRNYTCYLNENGTFRVQITAPTTIDTYTVTAEYQGTTKYDSASDETEFRVINSTIEMELDPVTVKYRDNATFMTIVTDARGYITDGTVTFRVNGYNIRDSDGNTIQVPIVDGVAILNATLSYAPGTYKYNAIFNGNSLYSSKTVNSTVTITSHTVTANLITPQTAYIGDKLVLKVLVYEEDSIVNGGNVTFKLGNVTLTDANGSSLINVVDGVAQIEYTIPTDLTPDKYKVTAIFSGDYYNTVELESNLNIKPHTVDVSTDIPQSAFVGDTVTFKATVTENGNLLNAGNIIFKLNGVVLNGSDGSTSYSNVSDGVVELNYTIPLDYPSGTYAVTAVFNASGYETIEVGSNLVVSRHIANVSASIPESAYVGDTVTFRATVAENGSRISNGSVVFMLDGVVLTDANGSTSYSKVVDGVVELEYAIPVDSMPKTYNVSAVFSADGFESVEVCSGLVVSRHVANVSVSVPEYAFVGDTVTFRATVTENGTLLNRGNVLFKLDGVVLNGSDGSTSYSNVSDGVVELEYAIPVDSMPKTYNISAIFAADGFESVEVCSGLVVSRHVANVNVTIPITSANGDTILIKAIVKENNTPVNKGNVIFKLNNATLTDASGSTSYSNVSNGVVELEYTIPIDLTPDVYVITATFAASGYESVEVDSNLVVGLRVANVGVSVVQSALVGDTITFKATVTENNTPLNSGNVIFKLNNATLTDASGSTSYSNVSDGVVELEYTIPLDYKPGTYTVTAAFAAEGYAGVEVESDLAVSRHVANVTAVVPSVANCGDTVVFKAIVMENNTPLDSGNVIFKLNGVTLNGSDGSTSYSKVVDGVVELEYTIAMKAQPKNYTVSIVFSNGGYEAVRLESNMAIMLNAANATNIIPQTAAVGDTVLFKVLVNKNGTPLNDGTVIFKINGVTLKYDNGSAIYSKVTNGVAQLEYAIPMNFSSKTYTVTSVFSCNGYETVRLESNLTINLKSANITVTSPKQAKIGDKITLKATVTSNGSMVNTGKVIFKINGKTVRDTDGNPIYVNVVNGVAEMDYIITQAYSSKTYEITAVFSSTGYEQARTQAQLTIQKTQTKIELDLPTINQGKNTTITGKIVDNNSNLIDTTTDITIKINGKTVAKTKSNKGLFEAVIPTSTLKSNACNITVVTGENDQYLSSRITQTVTIND